MRRALGNRIHIRGPADPAGQACWSAPRLHPAAAFLLPWSFSTHRLWEGVRLRTRPRESGFQCAGVGRAGPGIQPEAGFPGSTWEAMLGEQEAMGCPRLRCTAMRVSVCHRSMPDPLSLLDMTSVAFAQPVSSGCRGVPGPASFTARSPPLLWVTALVDSRKLSLSPRWDPLSLALRGQLRTGRWELSVVL